jgi:hypothetical protein
MSRHSRIPRPLRLLIPAIAAITLHAAASAAQVPQTAEIKKLRAIPAASGDIFGWDVLVEGDLVVVGAPHHDAAGADSGIIYIYERNTGGANNWGLLTSFTAPDNAAGDHFGVSVDLAGDILAVGAVYDDFGLTLDQGSVYIFGRHTGGANNWGLIKKISASDGSANAWFGSSVVLDGDTLAVGAQQDNSSAGAAYVFERNLGGADNWGEAQKLTASDGAAGDRLGLSVDLDGDFIIAGAQLHETTGAAYLFQRDEGGAGNWGEIVKFTPDDTAAAVYYGHKVAVDGSTIAIAAPIYGTSGAFYIYEQNLGGANNWGKRVTAAVSGSNGDQYGIEMWLELDTLLLGGDLGDGAAADTGAAMIFRRDEGGADNWGMTQKLSASDGFTNDGYGYSASMNGDTLVVGSWLDDDACPINPACNSGSAYIYYLSALPTATPTFTPSPTPTDTPTPDGSPSPTPTATPTDPPTPTPSATPSPTLTPTPAIYRQYLPLISNEN